MELKQSDRIIPETLGKTPDELNAQIKGIDAEIYTLGARITTLREIKNSLIRELQKINKYKTFVKGEQI